MSILLSGSGGALPPIPTFDLFELAGASNLESPNTDATDLPANLQIPQPDVAWSRYSRALDTLRPEVDGTFSPAITLGRGLADAGYRPWLSQRSIGGSTVGDWLAGGASSPLAQLVAYTDGQASGLPTGFVRRGLIWVSGADASDFTLATNYQTALETLRDTYQTLTGTSAPILVYLIHPYTARPFVTELRTSTAAFAAANPSDRVWQIDPPATQFGVPGVDPPTTVGTHFYSAAIETMGDGGTALSDPGILGAALDVLPP